MPDALRRVSAVIPGDPTLRDSRSAGEEGRPPGGGGLPGAGDAAPARGSAAGPGFALGLVALAAVELAVAGLLPPEARTPLLIAITLAVYAVGVLRRHALRGSELATRARLAEEQERGRVLVDRMHLLGAEDPLTGLANRRRWDAELAAACTAARARGGAVGVLLLDLDHFRRFGNRHGTPQGDAVLREVATVLATGVGDHGLVARLGSDEFAVLVPAAGEAETADLAERLRVGIERLRPDGEVTTSVGAAVAEGGEAFPLELMSSADAQLFRAKIARNSVAIRHRSPTLSTSRPGTSPAGTLLAGAAVTVPR